MHALMRPWPWYVAGQLIGLFVPLLLLLGNRQFGVSGSLRTICAAALPARADFFRYDWKKTGAWRLAFVAGIALGGALAAQLLGLGTPAIAASTRDVMTTLGIHNVSGLAPAEVFSWSALLTLRGFICMVLGGFLVGFGTAYAGGCTSGHGITGLATLQLPSLVAVIGFFLGGLFATFVILPSIL
ncbi:MAG: YeeE/YedE thiosulfate transporter family protein [Gemmatimonadaceae bacterium]